MKNKANKRYVLAGLTGPTGSGKTTAARAMKDDGCYVIDCDIIAKEVLIYNKKCINEILECFGQDLIDSEGLIKRKELAGRAFKSKQDTKLLNKITHHYIIEEVMLRARNIIAKDKEAVIIIDAPVLFESGLDKECDLTIAVIAPYEIRRERIMKRDNISNEAAKKRMSAQQEDSFYLSRCDYHLDGSKDSKYLYGESKKLIADIREKIYAKAD
ncbi:MAG: dephospho-CoA kinase [Clostridia bacterium]|nr:dephospho-CoA kinase [Clostridia bacterium]